VTTPKPASRGMNVRLAILSGCIIAATFLPFVHRPYSLTSDIAYQAFSARQYVDHEVSVLNTVSLADPRDLSKDYLSSSNFWPPCWPYLFTLAYKAGLAPGPAGRLLIVLMSISGAFGWIWVTSILGMKGPWRVAGVVLASLYGLRTNAMASLGAGDFVVYAVAPWILGPALYLGARQPARLNRRTVFQTALLALAMGSLYWLKYSAIFLGVPVLSALILGQFFIRPRRPAIFLAALSLYGVAFVAPVLANKVYNYKGTGTDLVESVIGSSKPRTLWRFEKLTTQGLFNVSTTLFSAEAGAERITRDRSETVQWLARLPGLALLAMLLLFCLWYPPGFLRTLVALMIAIPLVGFPLLSFVVGLQFTAAMGRSCGPFWILLELFILMLFTRPLRDERSGFQRLARVGLAVLAGSQVLLLLWTPIGALQELRVMYFERPPYQASEADLWVPDLSKFGTRDIDSQVRGLIRGPNDVVVPAVYANRSFGMDLWLEFGGRLLPLNTYIFRQSYQDGGDFFGTGPFQTSRPLRVILVAPNVFERKDFPDLVQHIKNRFVQAREWTEGPLDPNGRVRIWVTDLP
jgi:hypothetical protein